MRPDRFRIDAGCIRCANDLVRPERGAQWECTNPDCGAVVSDDTLRVVRR